MEFVSRKDAIRILSRHTTEYATTFLANDWKVRGVASVADYLRRIEEDVVTLTHTEKKRVEEGVREANRRLRGVVTASFDGRRAARLKWRFIVVKGDRYEGGYPHTVKATKNYIVLPKEMITSTELLPTLIHEKVHIYQRAYEEEMRRYLASHFIAVGRRTGRANPDIDTTVWQHRTTGRVYQTKWRTRPRTIADVEGESKYEHPFEEMAYAVEEKTR